MLWLPPSPYPLQTKRKPQLKTITASPNIDLSVNDNSLRGESRIAVIVTIEESLRNFAQIKGGHTVPLGYIARITFVKAGRVRERGYAPRSCGM